MTRRPRSSATLITRLALVVPMVFILLTLVFLLMRVAPGNPIAAALGGHVAAGGDRRRSSTARLRQAALRPVRRLPRGDLPRQLRHDDHRPAARSATIIERERRRDARAHVLRDDRRARRRHARSACSPGRFRDTRARRRRAPVRDRHLRDAGLLPRADGAARLRRLLSWLPTRTRRARSRRRRSRRTPTSSSSTRSSTATGARSGTSSST